MKTAKTILLISPIVFILAFLAAFFLAVYFYPGGHRWLPSAEGYSWLYNYFCDHLHHRAFNGQPNIGRPFILWAFVFLILSFLAFWVNMINFWLFSSKQKPVINLYGLLVVVDFSLLTWFHDLVLDIAMAMGLLGLVYLIFFFYVKKEIFVCLITAVLLLFTSLNYISWRQEVFLKAAPLLQKAVLLAFVIWVAAVSLKVFFFNRRSKESL